MRSPKWNERRKKDMRFILMMTGTRANWDEYAKWSKEDLEQNVAFMRAFGKELKDSGVFVATEGLGWPGEAKMVRAGKNGEAITDGVFPESKEFLAGYWIIGGEPGASLQNCGAGFGGAGTR